MDTFHGLEQNCAQKNSRLSTPELRFIGLLGKIFLYDLNLNIEKSLLFKISKISLLFLKTKHSKTETTFKVFQF